MGHQKLRRKQKKVKTHTIKAEDISLKLELSGKFDTSEKTPIIIKPKKWKTYELANSVGHAEKVSQGDLLLEFDPQDYREAVKDSKLAIIQKELSLKQATAEYEVFKKIFPMDEAAKKDQLAYLIQDRQYATEVLEPLQAESLEFRLRSAKNSLSYQEEELKQLLKMYKEDDLTEETEEIILKRTKDSVERAKFSYKLTEQQVEHDKKVSVPRKKIADEVAFIKQKLALQTEINLLPIKKLTKEIEIDKLIEDLQEARKSHDELVEDEQWLNIKSPIDGYVYYGDLIDGKLETAAAIKKLMVPFGAIPVRKVVLTLFSGNAQLVVAEVEEADFKKLRKGTKATISPKFDSNLKLNGKVKTVSNLPNAAGKYNLVIELEKPDEMTTVYPAMNCSVTIKYYNKKNAIMVPKETIFTENGEKFIYKIVGKKTVKTKVTTGKTNAGKVEILTGAVDGDVISSTKPTP